MDTTNTVAWQNLTPEEKRRELYTRQVATLDISWNTVQFHRNSTTIVCTTKLRRWDIENSSYFHDCIVYKEEHRRKE